MDSMAEQFLFTRALVVDPRLLDGPDLGAPVRQ
jgi:hypothetical protein